MNPARSSSSCYSVFRRCRRRQAALRTCSVRDGILPLVPVNHQGRREGMELRALGPEGATALTLCFRRCYGNTYPAAEFYDPEAIRRRLEDGTLRSVVAVTSTGEIVGHTALSVHDVGARVAEAGNTVVDPAYRGRGLLR